MKKVRVCNGRWCQEHGAKKLYKAIKQAFGLKFRSKNDSIDLDYCNCLGYCSSAPNVGVEDNIIFNADPKTIKQDIEDGGEETEKKDINFNEIDNFLGDM